MRYVRAYPTELPVLRDLLAEIQTPVQIGAGHTDPVHRRRRAPRRLRRRHLDGDISPLAEALITLLRTFIEDVAPQVRERVGNSRSGRR
jgi:hypothetical protein